MAPLFALLLATLALTMPFADAGGPRFARGIAAKDEASITTANSARDFIPSLYRVCLGPGLSNCLFPLRPGREDVDRAAENTEPVLAAEGRKRDDTDIGGQGGGSEMEDDGVVMYGSKTVVEPPSRAQDKTETHTGTIWYCGVWGESCKNKEQGNGDE